MRTHLRVAAVLALGIASSIVACSSSDDPSSPVPTDGSTSSSSGSSGSSSGSSGTSGTSGGPTDAATDAADAADANVPFTITSTAFTEGTAIPLAQAQNCTNSNKMKINGSDESPPLAWTSGPPGTLSYAIELHDATNNLVHAVTFDVPPSLRALPGKISRTNQIVDFTPNPPGGGVKQAKNISNTFGYAGPCPPNQHTYEFILYAVDVATLPNATATTTKEAIVTALKAHMVATTKLTGTFTP